MSSSSSSSSMPTGGQGGDSGSDGWDKPGGGNPKFHDVVWSMMVSSVPKKKGVLRYTTASSSHKNAKRVQFPHDDDQLEQVQVFDNTAAMQDIPKSQLFVTKQEKIGRMDDLDEVVYEYVHGGDEHQAYRRQLEQLWNHCQEHSHTGTASSKKDLQAIATNCARGLEFRFLPDAQHHRSHVQQQVLSLQKTLQHVPMMGGSHRSKLLSHKYAKWTAQSQQWAHALAQGDALAAEAYQRPNRKTLAATCA